jgi:hypothetical protein
MSQKPLNNIAASVRQRLLNKARTDQRPFNELLQYYAMERFLYRLSCSPHAECFILKGALMLRAWRAPLQRPTMDIDMLGRTSNDEAQIRTLLQEVLAVEVPPDGLVFDASRIITERIAEDADYEGIRLRFPALLGTARITVQIDIGFSDRVYPGPEEVKLPTILDFPPPRLLGYTRESAIAEKFEAMIALGELNSRMKDFYDIWLLSRQFDFDGQILAEAIAQTMDHRHTALPDEVSAFSERFITAKQAQWRAFRNRLGQEHIPVEFSAVVTAIDSFLRPIMAARRAGLPFVATWVAPGPWE